jgi:hypothetical protein
MKQKIIVVVVLSFLLIGISFFVFMSIGSSSIVDDWKDNNGNKIGVLTQKINILYTDGSSTTVGNPASIYNQDKPISELIYVLIIKADSIPTTLSIENYYLHLELFDDQAVSLETISFKIIDSYLSEIESQETTIIEYAFSPFDLIDYAGDFEEGSYTVRVSSSGHIYANGSSTNLPSSFDFSILFLDNRFVNIEFI